MSEVRGTLVVELYDTTLRDGAQGTGFSYSIEDRLRILHKLDQVGFPYVEGGWPGANPRDTEFFKLAAKLGLLAGDPDRFVADELERVWALYGGVPTLPGAGPDRLL